MLPLRLEVGLLTRLKTRETHLEHLANHCLITPLAKITGLLFASNCVLAQNGILPTRHAVIHPTKVLYVLGSTLKLAYLLNQRLTNSQTFALYL